MPFTAGEFFAVFVRYNLDVWPIQVILLAAAAATTLLAMRGRPAGARIASWILAALWIWMGAAYHIAYFSRVNPAAYVFGVLFVGQGFIYAWEGGIRNRLGFRVRWDLLGVIGGVLIVHALLIYPLIGLSLGRVYPASPTFGLPCPTTIFTFGILLWIDRRVPVHLAMVPLLWAVIGTSAVFSFDIVEDAALAVAGAVTAILLFRRNRRLRPLNPF